MQVKACNLRGKQPKWVGPGGALSILQVLMHDFHTMFSNNLEQSSPFRGLSRRRHYWGIAVFASKPTFESEKSLSSTQTNGQRKNGLLSSLLELTGNVARHQNTKNVQSPGSIHSIQSTNHMEFWEGEVGRLLCRKSWGVWDLLDDGKPNYSLATLFIGENQY